MPQKKHKGEGEAVGMRLVLCLALSMALATFGIFPAVQAQAAALSAQSAQSAAQDSSDTQGADAGGQGVDILDADAADEDADAAGTQDADTATKSSGTASSKDTGEDKQADSSSTKKNSSATKDSNKTEDKASGKKGVTQTEKEAADGAQQAAEGSDAATDATGEADKAEENANELPDDMPAEEREAKLKEEAESLKGKADEAAERLDELAATLESSYEDLNQVNKTLAETQNEIAALEKKVQETKERLDAARAALGTTAKEMYRTGGGGGFISVLLGSRDFDSFISNGFMLNKIASGWEDTISEAGELKKAYNNQKNSLAAAQKKQNSLQQEATKKGTAVALAMSDQSTLLQNLDSSTLKKAQEFDNATGGDYADSLGTHTGALTSALSAKETWYNNADDSTSTDGSHPAAVEIAKQYLGIDYVWAGASPSGGFDCSGLVLYVYAQLGIDMPHFARSQYDCGQHIAYSALMPGDLVFFGSSVETIHHVGIYIGNGQFIHAPQTGDVVKISNLSSRKDLIGACRP